jgi:hypothetical protein
MFCFIFLYTHSSDVTAYRKGMSYTVYYGDNKYLPGIYNRRVTVNVCLKLYVFLY